MDLAGAEAGGGVVGSDKGSGGGVEEKRRGIMGISKFHGYGRLTVCLGIGIGAYSFSHLKLKDHSC